MIQTNSYSPLDNSFDECPKYAELPANLMGTIACAITYANRNLSDGRIPKVWPSRRFGKEGPWLAKRLVELGIWSVRSDGDYEIVGFLDHNRSREEVLALRAKKRAAGQAGGQASAASKRQASGQASAQPTSLHVTALHIPPLPPDVDSVREAGEAKRQVMITNASSDGHFGGTVDAWRGGLSRVTGQPTSPLARGALEVLIPALKAHTPTGAEPVAWAGEIATEYANAHRGKTLSPFGFADWLASGKPKPAQRAEVPPSDGPRVLEERRARDASSREAAENRTAIPLGALLAVGAAKAKRPSKPPAASEAESGTIPVLRNELTDEELEARRQEQLRALEAMK